MAESHRPTGDDIEPQSRRLTPSIGLGPEPSRPAEVDIIADSSNEDFLFHLYRGSELLQDNRVHEAKEELERALRLQPRDTQGQDLLAVVYFRLGLYPRAIAIFEQLRNKNPRDTALLLNLALCYLKTGQPPLARTALEQLLELNPSHQRAWGYLGLACERMGDLETAERAFQQGGHDQMARRIATRRANASASVPPPDVEEQSTPTRGVRDVRDLVATAFKELDAGELSFELAREADAPRDEAEPWRPIELGREPSSPRPETKKPDTKDGPPPITGAAVPQLAIPMSARTRRPTLVVGAAPAASEPLSTPSVPGFDKIPSPRPPSFAMDERPAQSLRHPVVAVPPIRGRLDTPAEPAQRTKTLPPPVHHANAPPPPVDDLAAQSSVDFPRARGLVIHPSGVALVRTQAANAGFAVRLEALRASSNGLAMKLLERQAKGRPTGESFGGVGSPVVHATGDGQLVLAPRAGRKLSSFALQEGMCFVREEVLLGFDAELAYENGRLATGEGEFVSVVQFRGKGAVLLEAIGEVLSLDVKAKSGMSVRREVILGWFGRLVPRALAPSEAPCGQRGLVSFAGEGRVLVASA